MAGFIESKWYYFFKRANPKEKPRYKRLRLWAEYTHILTLSISANTGAGLVRECVTGLSRGLNALIQITTKITNAKAISITFRAVLIQDVVPISCTSFRVSSSTSD